MLFTVCSPKTAWGSAETLRHLLGQPSLGNKWVRSILNFLSHYGPPAGSLGLSREPHAIYLKQHVATPPNDKLSAILFLTWGPRSKKIDIELPYIVFCYKF